jgi:hypothetical protein
LGDDGFEDVYQMLDQACEMIGKKYLWKENYI